MSRLGATLGAAFKQRVRGGEPALMDELALIASNLRPERQTHAGRADFRRDHGADRPQPCEKPIEPEARRNPGDCAPADGNRPAAQGPLWRGCGCRLSRARNRP
jgi:hypothetical protein